jgi:hypothetical protein
MGRVPLSPVNGRRSRRRSSMRAGACDILLGSRFRKRIVSAPVWGAGVVARDTRRQPDNFNRVLLGACFTMYPPQSDPLRRRGTVAWTTHSNVARRPSSALRRVPCPRSTPSSTPSRPSSYPVADCVYSTRTAGSRTPTYSPRRPRRPSGLLGALNGNPVDAFEGVPNVLLGSYSYPLDRHTTGQLGRPSPSV